MRVLAVSSGGGHWVQLKRLAHAFDGHELVFATVSRLYRSEVGAHRFHVIPDATRWNKLGLVRLAASLFFLLLRERPSVVISTGAAPGYLALRLAKLFRCKTIWVDSVANVEQLSMSGRMIGRHCDLWLTQWPELAEGSHGNPRHPDGPRYAGSVF